MDSRQDANATHTSYRQDIDGLRAIAVLAVVIFHIQEHWLPGGFVGVDVFFVLSGYLISGQLYKQIQTGTFSLAEFYRRRIRRIVPAMIGVIGITVLAAQLLFRPEEAEATAESALWATLSLGNVYFWLFQDTSYFASSSLELPLLHLWSLGVEEQFYVFWPVMLWACGAAIMHRAVGWGIVLLIIASTALAHITYYQSHSFTYYMLPTRAGELMVGALAAFWIAKTPSSPNLSRLAVPLQIIGLMMIAASIALFDQSILFPGIAALLPTVGVGLMLVAGHYRVTVVSRLLSHPVIRFFGLISYSLYLWHWPILAFYRYGQFTMDVPAALGLFAFITLCGYLSYRLIETPFRHSRGSLLSVFMRYYAVPGGIIVVVCLASMKLDGQLVRAFDTQYNEALVDARNTMRPAYKEDYVCQTNPPRQDYLTRPACVIGESEDVRTLLTGDSNSAHYVGVWGALSDAQGGTFRNTSLGGCPPVMQNVARYARATRIADCQEGVPTLLALASKMETVVLSASWSEYTLADDRFLLDLAQTLDWLTAQGVDVVLFGKAPVLSEYDRRCPEKALSFPGIDCTVKSKPLGDDIAQVNLALRILAGSREKVHYADVNTILCPGDLCSVYDESGALRYYDSGHLTVRASWLIGEQWVATLPEKSALRTLASK